MTGEFQSQFSVTWLSLHFLWKMTFNTSFKLRRFAINSYAWNQLKYTRYVWINTNVLHHFSCYLYSVQTSNFATGSGINLKTNVKVALFKWANLIKTKWWLSVRYIAWGNHLGSVSYRQLVSVSCEMQLFHLVQHPPRSIDRPFAKHPKSLSFGIH